MAKMNRIGWVLPALALLLSVGCTHHHVISGYVLQTTGPGSSISLADDIAAVRVNSPARAATVNAYLFSAGRALEPSSSASYTTDTNGHFEMLLGTYWPIPLIDWLFAPRPDCKLQATAPGYESISAPLKLSPRSKKIILVLLRKR